MSTIPYNPAMPALVNANSDLNGNCLPPTKDANGITHTYSKKIWSFNHPELQQVYLQALCTEDNPTYQYPDGKTCVSDDTTATNYKNGQFNIIGIGERDLSAQVYDPTDVTKSIYFQNVGCKFDADLFTIKKPPTNAGPAPTNCPVYTAPFYGSYERKNKDANGTRTNTPDGWYCTPYANTPQIAYGNGFYNPYISNVSNVNFGYNNDGLAASMAPVNAAVVRPSADGTCPAGTTAQSSTVINGVYTLQCV